MRSGGGGLLACPEECVNSTHPSLLERLRQPDADGAWDRFVGLYTPLLFHWARGVGLRGPDAADLVQDVLVLLVRKMPAFQYDPRKSFRAWLRTVTLNKWRERLRRDSAAADAHGAAARPDAMAAFEETEYRRELVRQAVSVLRGEFPERTWQAFWRFAVAGEDAAAVAAALGLRVGSEYEKNLANFIRDIRKDLGVKNLPFVIAETGMSGPEEKHPRALSLMKAQAAVAEYEEFKGKAAFVGTRSFWRDKEASPTGQAYHWNNNAETYYLIGEAMGQAMKKLCETNTPSH